MAVADSVMCLQVDVVWYGIVRYGTSIVDYSMISLPYRRVRAPIFHFFLLRIGGLIPKGIADCLINCDIVKVFAC